MTGSAWTSTLRNNPNPIKTRRRIGCPKLKVVRVGVARAGHRDDRADRSLIVARSGDTSRPAAISPIRWIAGEEGSRYGCGCAVESQSKRIVLDIPQHRKHIGIGVWLSYIRRYAAKGAPCHASRIDSLAAFPTVFPLTHTA